VANVADAAIVGVGNEYTNVGVGTRTVVRTGVTTGARGNAGTTGGRVNRPGTCAARVGVLLTVAPGNGGDGVFGRGVPGMAMRACELAVLVGGGVLVAGCMGRGVTTNAGGGTPGTSVVSGTIVLFTRMPAGTSVPNVMMIAVAGMELLVGAAPTGTMYAATVLSARSITVAIIAIHRLQSPRPRVCRLERISPPVGYASATVRLIGIVTAALLLCQVSATHGGE